MSSFTQSLVIEDLNDGRHWRNFRRLEYRVGAKDSSIYAAVPAGFTTDLASIPRVLHSVVPKTGRGNSAAVLHDWLYQNPWLYRDDGARLRLTRGECDLIFYEALLVLKVSTLRREAMYSGVQAGGWVPWNRYRRSETP